MGELPVMVRGLAVWLLFMKTKFKVWPLPAGWRDPPVPFQCECEGQASATTKDIREGLLEGPLTPLGLGGNQGTGREGERKTAICKGPVPLGAKC